jgi:transposase InsO family protein
MIRASRYRLGRHDRITIDGAHHRHVKAENGHHVLEVVVDDTAQHIFVVKSDDDLGRLFGARRCRVEEGYYSQACALLRVRHDTSDLVDLTEQDLRRIAWREQWVKKLLALRQDLSGDHRPKMVHADLARFIEAEKGNLNAWYIEAFGEPRPLGRNIKGKPRKAFDWPSPSLLKNWVRAYIQGGARIDALKTAYDQCGRKPYLDKRIRTIVERRAEGYADSRKVSMDKIILDVESDLAELAARTGENLKVSATTIRKLIRGQDAFKTMAGREGVGFAERMFAPIGKGIQIPHPLGRVEIDDWTADLFVLTQKSSVWKSLTREQRALVPRVRVTITVAIDVATRCIVGFHMSTSDPSTHGSKTCLSRVLVDKTQIAQWAGCVALWVMAGRPEFVATDGGPAFLGDFEFAVARIRAPRVLPEQDPRLRGSIESFFRFFKRVCRFFAGQSFANVLERGDYQSEQMAALTYEQFYKACIRFIVDFYHHRPHRGLEGATPSGAWDRLVAKFGVAPPLSDEQAIQAFGFRATRRLDQHGVTFEKLTFNSELLNVLCESACKVAPLKPGIGVQN